MCQACQADTNFHPTGVTLSGSTGSVIMSAQINCTVRAPSDGQKEWLWENWERGWLLPQSTPFYFLFILQRAATVLNNITNAKWETHTVILVWFWWWLLLLLLVIQSNLLDNYQ